ncbi:hypothetical protein LJB93_00355 [Desulfovibrio sp. OttesenSCG-928-F07]|nr:hypothetical protein [Desulfovibrio sp. OttesenSCG-928-F07]
MNKKIIYLPTLHPELTPKYIPADILHISPGLALPKEQQSQFFTSPALPFTAPVAASLLSDLLSFANSLGSGASLKEVLGHSITQTAGDATRIKNRQEETDLQNFVATGQATPEQSNNNNANALKEEIAAELQNAQKILLLAFEHEQNIIDITELEAKVKHANSKLQAALSDSSFSNEATDLPDDFADDELKKLFINNEYTESTSMPEYPWQVLVQAIGAFLPQDSLLITAHKDLSAEVLDTAQITDLPTEYASYIAHWPADFTAKLTFTHLPLWQICGLKKAAVLKPWLNNTYGLLIVNA